MQELRCIVSAKLLLALRHQLEVLQELQLWHSAADRTMYPNIGHLAGVDAGDGDFNAHLLTLPVAADVDGWQGYRAWHMRSKMPAIDVMVVKFAAG